MARPITLRIDGKDVSPDTVQLADLLGLLKDFQTALIATAAARGVPKDQIRISLTKVGPGSDKLSFAANAPTHRQASRVIRAIASDDPKRIPACARISIHDMWSRLKSREWTLEINAPFTKAQIEHKAVIVPSKEPFVVSRASGSTSQLAYILRAGGEKPTVQFRLPSGTKFTAKVATQSVAEELGQHLYHWVELVGDAKWAVKSWKLDEFLVRGLGAYREKGSDPSRALDELRKLAGGAWDQIDPEAYVQDLRSDD